MAAKSITAGVPFTLDGLMRAGTAAGYATTVPAGQVGLISFGSSLNSFDDFKVHDLAGPYEVDGRYFAEVGDVQVDASNSNELKIDSTVSQNVPVVRKGFRADTFVATFKFYWSTPCRPGLVFGYQDPSNWYAVELRSSDGKAKLIKRSDDGNATVLGSDPNAMTLTNNTWYTAKVVVDYHPTFTTTYVRLWVDTDIAGGQKLTPGGSCGSGPPSCCKIADLPLDSGDRLPPPPGCVRIRSPIAGSHVARHRDRHAGRNRRPARILLRPRAVVHLIHADRLTRQRPHPAPEVQPIPIPEHETNVRPRGRDRAIARHPDVLSSPRVDFA